MAVPCVIHVVCTTTVYVQNLNRIATPRQDWQHLVSVKIGNFDPLNVKEFPHSGRIFFKKVAETRVYRQSLFFRNPRIHPNAPGKVVEDIEQLTSKSWIVRQA
jgi:hypothetical protein